MTAPALPPELAAWFAARGWSANATALADYLRAVDRPLPDGDVEVVTMVDSITLVDAVKGAGT